MRSSLLVWLFACMYAFTAQMCCCQRADAAMFLTGGTGVASVEISPIGSVKRIACCSKCAGKENDRQKSSGSDRKDSKSKNTSNNCDDCDQCAAGAHVEGGTTGKHIDTPAPASLNVLASLCASGEAGHSKIASQWIAHDTTWDAGQATLVRMHCALMV